MRASLEKRKETREMKVTRLRSLGAEGEFSPEEQSSSRRTLVSLQLTGMND